VTLPFAIAPAAIEALYAPLFAIGVQSSGGFFRAPWSSEESAAFAAVAAAALAGGLVVRRDALGNLAIETPGDFAEWIESGSHLDTVPGGGNFDGAAGVVAALAVLLAVQQQGIALRRGLRLRVWRGEESSAYGQVSMGARAAFALLPAPILEREFHGQRLDRAMAAQHCDPAPIAQGEPTIAAAERDGIKAHIELHIEQGSVLEQGQFDLGIVSGVRAAHRCKVRLHGAFDHSGATPMGALWRRDANLALARLLAALDDLAVGWCGRGCDLVQTVGVINAEPTPKEAELLAECAINKVSGYAHFSLEWRSCDNEVLTAFGEAVRATILSVASALGVRAEIETIAQGSAVAELDTGLRRLAGEVADEMGLGWRELPSGAWHDAAVVARVRRSDGSPIPVGLLFIPCRGGVSHSPEEWSSFDQIAIGATALGGVMLRLAHA